MSGEINDLSDEQLRVVLKFEEGHFGDLKDRRVLPAKLSESVSALANADGGELFVGIHEDLPTKVRSWVGFDRIEDANAHVQVLAGLFPFGEHYSFDFFTHASSPGFVLHIDLAKSRGIIKTTDGKVYVRKGAQNLSVDTHEKMQQLERNKGVTSFETETLAVDPNLVTNSVTTIRFMLDVVPTAEPEDWLRKQQVLVDGRPTVAGLVLFADEPQAVLPKRCGIKIYRYKTTDEGTRETLAGDPESIEGSAYDVIAAAVRRTEAIISEIPALAEKGGFEQRAYPTETLHEVITNAVLHRDYGFPDDIHLRIYDNRVEVQSPGRLPGHITEANILNERFARNPMIVRLINKFPNPPNKDVGEGLNTAFRAMTAKHLRPPEIKQDENSVVVFIRHAPLASPDKSIMDYLDENTTITNERAREITGIQSSSTIKGVLGRLRKKVMIEIVPGTRGRGAAWQKTKQGKAIPPDDEEEDSAVPI